MNKNNINDPSLFLDDEFKEVKLTPEKVVCLGMEFESEDARRAYFREELRKKLPELKQIEGFPIGEDDDIINLSDPPYYTACPNPWLNDFIAEWEKEKVELEKEGKRIKNFEVKVPYASDVSEGKNNPIYMAHGYHTKVPHTAIMRYILHYTQPGDIVFDGFCGSGMTGVASQLCNSSEYVSKLNISKKKLGIRHGICTDLAPAAAHISSGNILSTSVTSFEKKAHSILNEVEQKFGWMYETRVNGIPSKIKSTIWSEKFACPNCGSEFTLWDLAVDLNSCTIKDSYICKSCGVLLDKKRLVKLWETKFDPLINANTSLLKTVPVLINYSNSYGTGDKSVTKDDLAVLSAIENIDISKYRTTKLQSGEKTKAIYQSNHIEYIHQFYTKRSYIYLSEVYKRVANDPILLFWFTSTVMSLTKMNRFRFSGTGIMSGTFYIPSLSREFTPYETLKRKINTIKQTFYKERGNSIIGINSATDIRTLKNDSIDYIFIDPPFGANIMYSELSCIWEGWLGVKTNSKEETIVNKAQGKDIFDYQNLIYRSLKEFYRVLKSGKWMTVEFSNTSASVWNAIQNAIQSVGFIITNVAAIDKRQGSFNAVTTTTAVKQDLVITCYKPTNELILKFDKSLDKASNAMNFIEDLLVHLPVHLEKDNSTTAVIERSPKILYDRLISYYVQHGYAIPMDAQEFQKDLREHFIERDGMFFTASQALEYEEKKKKTNGIVPMALFISSEAEGIEWLKRELKTPQTYSEIQPEWMKNMIPVKKGDVLPELMTILEENFIKDEDGKWRNPDPEKAADLEIIRNRKMMKEFNMYLEQAQKPKAKRMKDTRLEVLRYGFKECYKRKDYKSIVLIGDHIQDSLLQEDEVLLQYYDIASTRV